MRPTQFSRMRWREYLSVCAPHNLVRRWMAVTKRWAALVRYLDDGNLPIDNNWVENQIRPWALGRSNWLFAGSLRSGQRGANVMTLIQSAKINGPDPQAYLRDVLERLPSARQSDLDDLLPHNWARGIKV